MRLYVDEDSEEELLLQLLRRAGHDLEAPSEIGMVGKSDVVQLRYAIKASRVLLSANHDDFRELDDLIRQAGGAHSGILIIRKDNDRRRDLTSRGIATAISHLLAAGAAIENEFIILNHWR
jgi:hypothetical protein